MSNCIICKKNCSPVKVAIFDGEGGLLGYGSKKCMETTNMQNTGQGKCLP